MEINLNNKNSLNCGIIDILEQIVLNVKIEQGELIKAQNIKKSLDWLSKQKKSIFSK